MSHDNEIGVEHRINMDAQRERVAYKNERARHEQELRSEIARLQAKCEAYEKALRQILLVNAEHCVPDLSRLVVYYQQIRWGLQACQAIARKGLGE